MAAGVFQKNFPIACKERGPAYVQARDEILKLEPAPLRQAAKSLKRAVVAPSDWQTQVTAEILLGWLDDQATFAKGDQYVRGELSGPEPVPGFTVRHRIESLAALGPAIVPRLLERVWKTGEYGDATERATLFGALQKLKDPRAVMPMIALIEDPQSGPDVQSSAASVLSMIGDPRGLEPVVKLATDPSAHPDARLPAIRSLGRFSEARAAQVLVGILQRKDLSLEDRRAAADGLLIRSDPATQPAVMNVLQAEQDELLRFTLVQVVGRIGTAAAIPSLQQIAAGSPALKDKVDDAIEDIQMRVPQTSP